VEGVAVTLLEEKDAFVEWACDRIRRAKFHAKWPEMSELAKKSFLVLSVCPWGPTAREITGVIAVVDTIVERAPDLSFARALIATIENARGDKFAALPRGPRKVIMKAIGEVIPKWKEAAAPPPPEEPN
jgi:hypothetical protein